MTVRDLLTLNDVDLAGKKVLVRVDFNVPLKDGRVHDDTRIRASLRSLHQILQAGGRLILMSHLGRPREGSFDPSLSLQPVADHLATLMKRRVILVSDWKDIDFDDSDIYLLENVRFLEGEKANDDALAQRMASLCDVYVNDAFATAHRAQASTHGVARYAPVACAGPLLVNEIEHLSRAFEKPAHPMVAIVGGSKVSTKLTVLETLLPRVDQLIVGGGIANTFLKAAGHDVGLSLYEADLVDKASELAERVRQGGGEIPMPVDVVCGKHFSEDAEAVTKAVDAVEEDDLIMDIGPETAAVYSRILADAATIIWNGPLGVFEFSQFGGGTRALAEAIAGSQAFSVAGGGDTLAAIAEFGVADRLSYISTGGGAFLEFLEGKSLPAITILEETAQAWRQAGNG
ncbi:MAG TPA: phosphoglycerate kinase [Gammaproteobacteria bacterium]|nr:phosphoglycerate kinase [Gammaproteobacteria bacterium]